MFGKSFATESIILNFLLDKNDWTTKKKELEIYIVAGNNLVKIQIVASISDLRGRATISCKVLELNGEIISQEDQDKNLSNAEFIDGYPTLEEQLGVVTEALAKFDIYDKPLSVSKDYAEGYLRVIRMRRRIREREGEGRGADVHI